MTVDEAIALVQKHERARQGRLRAKLMQEIRRQEQKAASGIDKGAQNISETMAAKKIQCHWRGVVARKKVKKKREDELVFIGMVSMLFIIHIHNVYIRVTLIFKNSLILILQFVHMYSKYMKYCKFATGLSLQHFFKIHNSGNFRTDFPEINTHKIFL